MPDKSEAVREEAREHDAAFAEAHERGDTIGSAFEAMHAIDADRKADELYRLEHPEVERLDHIKKTLDQLSSTLRLIAWCLMSVVVFLGLVTYKIW